MGKLAVSGGHALANLLGRRARPGRRALLIPPAIPGSLGDAAMISASSYFLRQSAVPTVDLLYGKEWSLDEPIDRRIGAERFFYQQSSIQQSLLISRLPEYSEVYFIGADVIDGAYNPKSVNARLSLLAEGARLGKRATLLGASYNANPEESTRKGLRALPVSVTICARDPVSRERMELALERPIRQVADLAFLLAPHSDHVEVRQANLWIAARRQAGDQVIGFNANYLHAEKNPQIPRALGILVEQLLKRRLSILLIPHDTRSERPDQKLLEEAVAALPAKQRERVRMLPPISPAVVRAVTPSLDMLVTGRMHAAILGMSGGTPAFCFAYQDKFEGLFRFFDLEGADLLSTPESLARDPAGVAEKILDRLKDAGLFRCQVQNNLPAVVELSKANFLDADASRRARAEPDRRTAREAGAFAEPLRDASAEHRGRVEYADSDASDGETSGGKTPTGSRRISVGNETAKA